MRGGPIERDLEHKAVLSVEVQIGGVDHIGGFPTEDPIAGCLGNLVGQLTGIGRTPHQGDRLAAVFIQAHCLRLHHQGIGHRVDGDTHRRLGRSDHPITHLVGEPVASIVVGIRGVDQIRWRPTEHSVLGLGDHKVVQGIPIDIFTHQHQAQTHILIHRQAQVRGQRAIIDGLHKQRHRHRGCFQHPIADRIGKGIVSVGLSIGGIHPRGGGPTEHSLGGQLHHSKCQCVSIHIAGLHLHREGLIFGALHTQGLSHRGIVHRLKGQRHAHCGTQEFSIKHRVGEAVGAMVVQLRGVGPLRSFSTEHALLRRLHHLVTQARAFHITTHQQHRQRHIFTAFHTHRLSHRAIIYRHDAHLHQGQ